MDDVLGMAEMLLRTRNTDALALVQTVEALAAEVRELRKDKARLDWLSSIAVLGKHRPDGRSLMGIYVETRNDDFRASIDAAMGGEAQTHD